MQMGEWDSLARCVSAQAAWLQQLQHTHHHTPSPAAAVSQRCAELTQCPADLAARSISGFHGMPSLRVRPKKLSRHGRQYVQDVTGRTIFNIGKESRFAPEHCC